MSSPLLDLINECHVCRGIGLWKLPNGDVGQCPNQVVSGADHNYTGTAAMIRRSVMRLKHGGFEINSHLFDLVLFLRSYTSERPCDREKLLAMHFKYLPEGPARLRHFHKAVEDLRRDWLLPLGSRKDAPSGYWIITEQKDFESWVKRSTAAPITQLSTIHRVARANFPVFAEQMELDFWSDIQIQEAAGSA